MSRLASFLGILSNQRKRYAQFSYIYIDIDIHIHYFFDIYLESL